MDRKWWTLHRRLHRHLHAAVGHHGRQRGPAGHPAIALHSSFADLQWVIDAYSLTLAVLPAHRRGASATCSAGAGVFAIGLAIFSVSSLALWALDHTR